MADLEALAPMLIGIIIAPITQWLKTVLPGPFPLQPVAISVALSFGFICLLSWALGFGASPKDMLLLALATNGVAQITHASGAAKSMVDAAGKLKG